MSIHWATSHIVVLFKITSQMVSSIWSAYIRTHFLGLIICKRTVFFTFFIFKTSKKPIGTLGSWMTQSRKSSINLVFNLITLKPISSHKYGKNFTEFIVKSPLTFLRYSQNKIATKILLAYNSNKICTTRAKNWKL